MPRRCAVLGCHKKNYDITNPISTFKFPDYDPKLLQQWLKNLNRPNWKPSAFSGLCAAHFRPEDFEIGTGQTKRPRLKDNAIPTIFDHLLKNQNEVGNLTSADNIIDRCMVSTTAAGWTPNLRQPNHADIVMSFANFNALLKDKLNLENYYLFQNSEKCVFYQVESSMETECNISLRISISRTLNVRILFGESEDFRHLERFQLTNGLLTNWTQMKNILDTFRNGVTVTERINCECLLKRALHYLNLVQTSLQFSDTDKLNIIINQVENTLRKHPKYSSSTVKMALLLFSHSHATLELLRTFLYLPSLRYVQHLSSNMQISTNFDITTKKDGNISDPENYVALIIDELYIDRGLQYKDDTLVGTTIINPLKTPKALLIDTKTILTFTIKSIFGKLQEIVRMSPAIYPFAEVLYSLTKDTLDYVQKMGFNVKLIIADTRNNSQRIFQKFSEQKNHFSNPNFSDQQIYLQYDVMQIVNDIRNDWLDLDNAGRTFIYPDIETFEIKEASFADLETLFETEKTNEVKKAPKLTETTINPNENDRHNVTLASNLFHDSTILALRDDDVRCETADFCETIKTWLDIGTNSEPIVLDSDPRFRYLENFAIWIKTWKTSRANPGRLKPATFHAIETTTKTLIEMIKFSLSTCQAEFFSLAKLQRDSPEDRYRFYESKIKSKRIKLSENFEEPDMDIVYEPVNSDADNDIVDRTKTEVVVEI